MAIPKKGSKRILFDGEHYRWLIRNEPTPTQSKSEDGKLTIVVGHSEINGSLLVIYTDLPYPKDSVSYKITAVLPSDIRRWMKNAIQTGWQPRKLGKQFELNAGEVKQQ
jgi:hypothetical protein